MNFPLFLQDSEWDSPVFKVLASNDTGAAAGHQAGIVVPKELRQFFPELNPTDVSPTAPTVDNRLVVELWHKHHYLATVDSRYQFQTWGDTRRPESRLTDNLGPLRNLARGGDLLIMQRHAIELMRYRLILIKQEAAADFIQATTSRWGLLGDSPVTDEILTDAAEELTGSEASDFSLFDQDERFVETRVRRLARTIVFRKQLLRLYEGRCAVCRHALRTPSGLSELEGAHIVPRNLGGTNDARNGLGLCRQHHWAFDKGLIGVDGDRKIIVPDATLRISQNASLSHFHGEPLLEASETHLRAHGSALGWHFENTMVKNH